MGKLTNPTGLSKVSIPPLLGGFVLIILLIYTWNDGIAHMLGVWWISPTYTHGFLVAPISIALIAMGWRRGEVAVPWPLALLGIGGASVLYASGTHFDIRLFQHTAIITGIISITILIMGTSFTWRHRFALGFLLFAVPFGEEFTPLLQEITAQAIMVVTAIAGLPAIRDGMLIQTDAGDFSVEEACAGLRFLTATIVSAALMTHLFFTKRKKQIAFLIAALILPLFANSIRAAGTVLVASWTNMEVAAGVDHLFYGWAFFFVILTALMISGFCFADADAPKRPNPQTSAHPRHGMSLFHFGIAAAILCLPRVF
ncbi:MAG: exosortase A [Pseudomonadota bacterium]